MKRLLAEMTWPDVARAVAAGATTVILPLGATEQHGPHLPLGTDTFRAMALAERLSSQIPGALIAPALPLGCSDEHTGFPGLLGLAHETLAGLIADCARRVAAWGIRRLIALSAHGGNGRALELAATRIRHELPELDLWIPPKNAALFDGLLEVADRDGIAPEAVGLHAGESETSQMLHLRPDLVRMDLAQPGYVGDMAEVLPRLLEAGLRPVTPNGVLGDPRGANGLRGERYLRQQVAGFREHIAEPPSASAAAGHGS
jgi:creatinine amidohydrolase